MQACPRDKGSLVSEMVRGFRVSHCKSCAGVWLPPALVATAVGHLPRLISKQEPGNGHRVLCPADRSGLVAVHHRGVEIDVCTACGGVWLDHGELDKILRTQSSTYKSENAPAKQRSTNLLLDVGSEAITNPDLLSAAGDFAADAAGAVLSFIGEALSGL